MSRTSRYRVLLFTVGLVGLLAGAGVIAAVSLGDRQTSRGGEAHEGVSAVDVRQDCGGDVTLVPAETATAVDVRWVDRWSASEPEHDAELTDGRLVVSARCPGVQLVWGSTSELTVGVPAGVPVTVDSGAGDVRAEGTSGDLDVRTGAGAVDVQQVTGRLTLSSGAGDVRVSGARAGQVAVDTGAGDVSVSATEPVGELTVRTDAGEVLVELPADGSAYAVRAGTDAGDVSIGVPEDPASPRVVDLESDAGDITVRTTG